MPTSLGPAEIMVILVVALIVLGPNRLPEAGRQVGKALAEVRRWTRDVQGEIKSSIDPEPQAKSDPVPPATPPPTPPSPEPAESADRASSPPSGDSVSSPPSGGGA